MNATHAGHCLCGAVRYTVSGPPERVIVCHCTFCQRVSGSAFLVMPVFHTEALTFSGESSRPYVHRSDESGLRVTLHACGVCATTLTQEYERMPGLVAVAAGTFEAPNWFERGPGHCQHIFVRSAQAGVVLPAHVDVYEGHFLQADGTPSEPVRYAQPVAAPGGD